MKYRSNTVNYHVWTFNPCNLINIYWNVCMTFTLIWVLSRLIRHELVNGRSWQNMQLFLCLETFESNWKRTQNISVRVCVFCIYLCMYFKCKFKLVEMFLSNFHIFFFSFFFYQYWTFPFARGFSFLSFFFWYCMNVL